MEVTNCSRVLCDRLWKKELETTWEDLKALRLSSDCCPFIAMAIDPGTGGARHYGNENAAKSQRSFLVTQDEIYNFQEAQMR